MPKAETLEVTLPHAFPSSFDHKPLQVCNQYIHLFSLQLKTFRFFTIISPYNQEL